MSFDTMINTNGKKKYAYVMLLIQNNDYVAPSIVLAESLKTIGCLAELVIMVDKSIDSGSIDLLKRFYDVIIHLADDDIIEINNPDPVQKFIGTKLYALKLDYEKIAIIDTDSIIFQKPNDVFELDTPGLIYDADKSSFNTGLVLLKPSTEDYTEIIKLKNKFEKELELESKPLLYLLLAYYKDFKKIDEKFLKSNSYSDSYGIQYNVNKPFLTKNSIGIETRSGWKHFQLWFIQLRKLLNKYPEIQDVEKYPCMKQSIELSKYYVNKINRMMIKRSHGRVGSHQEIQDLYSLHTNANTEYYHLDISKEYDNEGINYLVSDYNLITFVKYISNKTNIPLSPQIIDKIASKGSKKFNFKEIFGIIDDKVILEYILTEYVRLFSNVYIVMVINESDNSFVITKDLKKNLIYKKQIVFPGLILKSILFNVYQEFVYDQRIQLLNKYSDFYDYELTILVYQTESNFDFVSNKEKIIVFNDLDQKIRLSSVFFNQNTLSRFSNKKIKIDNDRKSIKKLLYFQTIKKWLFNNYSGELLENVIVINSKPFTILDLNTYDDKQLNKLKKNKIKLFNIIFKSDIEDKKFKQLYSKYHKDINNPYKFWELEGIKFHNDL